VGATLLRLLAGPRGPVAIAAVALLLTLPSLSLRPLLDDHGFRARLAVEGRGPNETFCFGKSTNGGFAERGPWWLNAKAPAPFCFMRPLSALSHFIDYRLWPSAWRWMRFENCLLYAALAALAAAVYLRLSGWGAVAVLAAAMFAVDEAHAQALGVIAYRNTLLWPLLGLLALVAHDAHRSAPTRLRAALGPVAFALALLAGEGGIATLGYLAAYALCLDRDTPGERVRSLLPYLAIAALWGIGYGALGYGAVDNDLYRNPRRDPLGTLANGLLDLPVWLATQLTFGFATASIGAPPALVRLAGAAIVIPLALLLWPTLRDSRIARFYGVGLLLSLAPLLLTVPQDRLLALPSFGGFGLLGCFFDRTVHGLARRTARAFLVAIHLVIAPLAFVPTYLLTGRIAIAESKVDAALPQLAEAARTGAVIVHVPVIGSLGYALSKRRGEGRPLPRYSYELFVGPAALEVTRVGERTIDLEPRGGYCSSRTDCFGYDLTRPFHAGQVIELSDMRVEIRELNARGMPQRVRFHFPSPLEDSSRRWLIWTPNGVEPFALPALHQTLTLPGLSRFDVFRLRA
jgi:hypothetical protein